MGVLLWIVVLSFISWQHLLCKPLPVFPLSFVFVQVCLGVAIWSNDNSHIWHTGSGSRNHSPTVYSEYTWPFFPLIARLLNHLCGIYILANLSVQDMGLIENVPVCFRFPLLSVHHIKLHQLSHYESAPLHSQLSTMLKFSLPAHDLSQLSAATSPTPTDSST